MNAKTLKTLGMALLAALLTTAPAVAAEPNAERQAPPCEAFYYTLDPPGYKVDPSCIGPLGLLFDNSP